MAVALAADWLVQVLAIRTPRPGTTGALGPAMRIDSVVRGILFGIILATGCMPTTESDLAGAIDGDTSGALTNAGLSAHYAMAVSVTTTVKRKTDGLAKSATYRLDGLVTAQQTDNRVALHFAACNLALPVINKRSIIFKNSIIPSTTKVAIEGTIDADGTLQTRSAAWQLGVALADPLHDGMPSDGAAPTVVDADSDGNPGVSVSATGFSLFDIFIAVRSIASFRAPVPPPGTAIEGDASVSTDWVIYGDTVPLEDVRALADKALAGYDAPTTTATFRMEPKPDATCKDAAAVMP